MKISFWFGLLISLTAFGQARTTKNTTELISKSEVLTEFTAWKYKQQNDSWVKNSNVIYDESCSTRLCRSYQEQNLDSLCVSTYLVNTKDTLHFLEASQWFGSYEYPSIYEGWEVDYRRHFFYLSSSLLKKISNIIDSCNGEYYSLESCAGYLINNSYNGKITNKRIMVKAQNFDVDCYFKKKLLITAQKIEEERVVRILLWTESRNKDKEALATEYFEFKLEDFRKILNFR